MSKESFIPELTETELQYGTTKKADEFFALAKENGFAEAPNNPYCQLYQMMYQEGGTIKRKFGVAEEVFHTTFHYIKAISKSSQLTIGQKEAIGAYLLSIVAQSGV